MNIFEENDFIESNGQSAMAVPESAREIIAREGEVNEVNDGSDRVVYQPTSPFGYAQQSASPKPEATDLQIGARQVWASEDAKIATQSGSANSDLTTLPESASQYSTADKVGNIATATAEPFRALGEWVGTKTLNLGISSLFSLSNAAYNVMNDHAIEPVMHALGYEDYEAPSDAISPEQAARFYGSLKDYQDNKLAYDLGGNIVDSIAGFSLFANAMTKGSSVYNLLSSTGVSSKYLNYLFASADAAKTVLTNTTKAIVNLASKGISPKMVMSAGREAVKNAKAILPDLLKTTLAGEVGAFALTPDKDLMYPTDNLSVGQMAFWYGALPVSLGVALPAAGVASKTRQLFVKGEAKATKAFDKAIQDSLNIAEKSGLAEVSSTVNGVSYSDSMYYPVSAVLEPYGLAGNSASDVATAAAYRRLGTERVYQKTVSDLAAKSGDSPSGRTTALAQAETSFQAELANAELETKQAISRMVDKNLSPEAKKQVVTNIASAMKNSPNILVGADSVSQVPTTNKAMDNLFANKLSRQAKLEKQIKSARSEKTRKGYEEKLDRLKSVTYSVVEENGNIVPASEYHISFRDNPANAKKYSTVTKQAFGKALPKSRVQRVDLFEDDFGTNKRWIIEADIAGNVKTNGGGMSSEASYNWLDESIADATWGTLQKQLLGSDKQLKSIADKGYKPVIDLRKINYFQSDYLLELINRNGLENVNSAFKFKLNDVVSEVMFKRGLDGNDLVNQLRYLSLDSKRNALKYGLAYDSKLASNQRLGRFNLASLFDEVYNLRSTSGQDINQMIETLADSRLNTVDLLDKYRQSNRLNYSAKQPSIVRSTVATDLTQDINYKVYENLAESKSRRLDGLVNSKNDFVKYIANRIDTSPQYQNGYITNVRAMSYSTDEFGSAGKYILTQDEKSKDIVKRSAISANNQWNADFANQINQRMKPIGESLSKTLADSESTEQFAKFVHQMRSGWFLEDAVPEALADGSGYVFRLPSEGNGLATNKRVFGRQARLNGLADEDIIDMAMNDQTFEYLLDPISLKPLVVNKTVADAAVELNRTSTDIWEAHNAIGSALGYRESAYRPYHVPPKNLANQYVKVVTTTDGRPITFVSASTPAQAQKLAEDEIKILKTNANRYGNKDYRVAEKPADPEAIGLHKATLFDQADNSMFVFSDYRDMFRQTLTEGGQSVRTSMGNIIDEGKNLVKELLYSLNNSYQRIGVRTRMAMFSDEINYAMNQLSRMNKNTEGYQDLLEYISALSGKKLQGSPALLDKFYKAIDDIGNRGGKAISDWTYGLTAKQREYAMKRLADVEAGRAAPQTTSRAYDNFEDMQAVYEFSAKPFDEALAYASRKNKLSRPATSQSVVSTMNRLVTKSMLQLGNLGYALMNLVSLPATEPAVRQALGRRLGESIPEWQSRIGAYGAVTSDGKLALDTAGGMASTLAWMFSKEGKRVAEEAASRGYFTPQQALMNEIFVDPAVTALGKTAQKVSDGIAYLANKSEEFSRALPFFQGYRIAKIGGLSEDSAFSFANKYANDVVGSYIASNRPIIFQESAGNLFGLFYTYAHNLLQRNMKYFINGDYSALATQGMIQSFMFGAKSLPLADEVENYFFPIKDGKDMYTGLRDLGFDDRVTRAVLYGPLSAASGLDFSAKGTINEIRVPGLQTPPSLSIIRDAIDGVNETINALATNTQTSPNRLWEIWQTRAPSPAIKSAIDLKLGYTTNRNGEITVDESSVGKGIYWAANLLGMRSLDERISSDLVRRNSLRTIREAEKMNQVRKNLQSTFRQDGGFGSREFTDSANDYLANGGKASSLKNWVKLQAVNSQMPKIAKQVKDINPDSASASDREARRGMLNFLGMSLASPVDSADDSIYIDPTESIEMGPTLFD